MEKLRILAGKCAGMRYDSKRAQKILELGDWQDCWPVCDAAGLLTGDIVGTEEGYLSVSNTAMVAVDDLSPEQIKKNGGRNALRENGHIDL